MRFTLTVVLAALLAQPLAAQETGTDVLAAWEADRTQVFDARGIDLASFLWRARPIVIFADTDADPRFQQQLDLLAQGREELAERDVVVITDTSPDSLTAIREQLRPRGFMLAIIGKDGTVLIRKPLPWNIREITRNIDKLPSRQQEIIDRRAAAREAEAEAEAALVTEGEG